MLSQLKKSVYFVLAGYFRFFANIKLQKWHPRIVVVTGSNGKTTTLQMVESQLKTSARYSHHANSSFGIPFDILGLTGVQTSRLEWLGLIFSAPIRAFASPYPEKIYVIEADCDRPGEGYFLGSWLRPEVTIWLSSARTHGMYFDKIVAGGKFSKAEEAIAYEFGNFLEFTSKLAIVNGDEPGVMAQQNRTQAQIEAITRSADLQNYAVDLSGTKFSIENTQYQFPEMLLPEESFYSIKASLMAADYFGINRDNAFTGFSLPPSRSSVFAGKQGTTLIDSSYNANVASVTAILNLVGKLPGANKWLVLGDLIEQGELEDEEQKKLIPLILSKDFQKVLLIGPRLARAAYPDLKNSLGEDRVQSFCDPAPALHYLQANLNGGETIVFKGARFLEGIVEHLLADPANVTKLCRQEPSWRATRKEWGL